MGIEPSVDAELFPDYLVPTCLPQRSANLAKVHHIRWIKMGVYMPPLVHWQTSQCALLNGWHSIDVLRIDQVKL